MSKHTAATLTCILHTFLQVRAPQLSLEEGNQEWFLLLPINLLLQDSQRKFNYLTLGEQEDVQDGIFL